MTQPAVMTVEELGLDALAALFSPYGLACELRTGQDEIPGSFWGDSEAGLVGSRLIVRPDTPVHSALHEGCHFVCMTPQRRAGLHTDAGGGYDEENAVCYLQILFAERLEAVGRWRLMQDMDAWGYSFRLGSARAWFEQDAEDARLWLLDAGVIDADSRPTGRLRLSGEAGGS